MRSSMVAAELAAAVGCAFDFDVDFNLLLAQRTLLDWASGAPLNSARGGWEEYSLNSARKRLETAAAPGKD
jgi:hypothetical protein